ncbi:MAG TPA: Gfo/Idh/MocA family oxidoreductase [Phycisphaerae bacterium]|nr:Gfo/Idh/MocA family oxidoreductase [Phycisphaerae bacterium]
MAKRLRHVNVAVIGLGMGGAHLKGYAEHPGCTIAAICDVDKVRLAAKAAEFGLDESRLFTSTDALFRAAGDLGLDAASVVLPNTYHAPVTIQALRRGLHVLCEKPMAMNAGQARRMMAEARKARRTLGINLSFRFVPQSRALKDVVDAGTLGRVYYAHTRWWRQRGLPGLGGWFGTKRLSGGGPVIDLGVHRMDLAMWLMGSPQPVAVSAAVYDPIGSRVARLQKKTFDVEDLGAAFVRFQGGATLTLEASWAGFSGKNEDMVTEILGDRGGIVQRNLGEGYDFEARVFTETGGSLAETQIKQRLAPAPSAYADFVDAVLEGRPTLAPAEDGLKVQQVLDAIYRSARLGKEVRIR